METCIGTHFLKDDQILPRTCFHDYFAKKTSGIYEVIRIIEGIPLFSEKHIQRLNNSASFVNLDSSLSPGNIMKRIFLLVKITGLVNGNVKILLEPFANNWGTGLHCYTYFIPHHYPTGIQYKEGVPVVLIRAERSNPNVKAVNQDMRSRIDTELKSRSAYEALLVDTRGNITEGSRSNVFFVKNNQLFTSGNDSILPGITRDAILEICKTLHYQVIEEPVSEGDLNLMDAVFITGTSPKVLPVNRIDDLVFDSASHPVVQNIITTYQELMDKYIESHKG